MTSPVQSARPRGRYAPSPTGPLHIGNARTALLAWWQIRALGGGFVLRIEDLDPARSVPATIDGLVRDLEWLGIDWDEGPGAGGSQGPYLQSQRSDLYAGFVDQLLRGGQAYPCSCSRAEVARAAGAPHVGEEGPRYPGTCRDRPAHPDRSQRSIRLRIDAPEYPWNDLVLGPQRCDLASLTGDVVIRRADGVAAYQLACAVDDALMEVTHVVRGGDLLTSTPRQMAILSALGLPIPRYGHVPLVVGSDGKRLAKRDGSLSLAALREAGVDPRVVVGKLALSAGLGDGSPMSAAECVPLFDVRRLNSEPGVWM